jgi:DNA-binding transcriptional LysR family regulator
VQLLPLVIGKIRELAPQAGLVIHALNAGFDYAAALENGELDCVIGNWPDLPPHLHIAQLFEDEVVCMVNRNHPVVSKGLSLKYYLEMAHLAPTPYMAGHRSIIDSTLAEMGHAPYSDDAAVFRYGAVCAGENGFAVHYQPQLCAAMRQRLADSRAAGAGGNSENALLHAVA